MKTTWRCSICQLSERDAESVYEPLLWVSERGGEPKPICRSCLKDGVRNNWEELNDDGDLPNAVIGGVILELFSEAY